MRGRLENATETTGKENAQQNSCGYSNEENITKLQKCLICDALETVRVLLVSPKNTADVMEMLKRRFGRLEYNNKDTN